MDKNNKNERTITIPPYLDCREFKFRAREVAPGGIVPFNYRNEFHAVLKGK
jgi:hypothetical protein